MSGRTYALRGVPWLQCLQLSARRLLSRAFRHSGGGIAVAGGGFAGPGRRLWNAAFFRGRPGEWSSPDRRLRIDHGRWRDSTAAGGITDWLQKFVRAADAGAFAE